jgi:hypothetical protein
VAEQEFQTSGSELVQATSNMAALTELTELENQARRLEGIAPGKVQAARGCVCQECREHQRRRMARNRG